VPRFCPATLNTDQRRSANFECSQTSVARYLVLSHSASCHAAHMEVLVSGPLDELPVPLTTTWRHGEMIDMEVSRKKLGSGGARPEM